MIFIISHLPHKLSLQQEVTQENYSSIIKIYMQDNFYSNRVINDWNSLPQFIVDSPSVN